MNFDEIKGLKYYLMYAVLAIGFFAYSANIGWKWFNPTQTTHEKGEGTHRTHGGRIYYHK